jgi:hypothetical protein
VGGGQAGRHLGGGDHPLAEAVERDRVPRRGGRPGPAAARRPGPPGPGPSALVGEPAAALGAFGGRAPRRAGRRRVPPRADPAAGRAGTRRCCPRPGRRAAHRHRGRLHADLPAVRARAGLGAAPVTGGAGRRRGRGVRHAGARLPVGRLAHLPYAGPAPGQGRRGHLLSADLGHVPAPVAAADVGPGRHRVFGPGRGNAVAPAGHDAGDARHPARAGHQHRLAVHLVLPAALVQHDGHRRARGLLGLPARLGRCRAADRRNGRAHARHGPGHPPALAGPAGVPELVPADAAGPVLLPGLPGLALRHRGLEPRAPAGGQRA